MMARRILTVFIALIFSITFLSGQQVRGTISGTVTDSQGHPLAAASVVIDSLRTGVSAGNDGRYMIRGLKNGTYTVHYSFIGYTNESRTIKLEDNAVVNVTLQEETYITDAVVVRAVRASNRTPMAFTTVEASSMQRSDMTRDIPFLLSLTPSVVETSDAGNGVGYTSLRIRGTDANRINVTIDGIPLNDPESQQVFWVDLPDLASSAGDIQIQRGVGTSANGSGAFGASMNISTITIPDKAGAEADLSAGSFNTFRATAKAWSGLINDNFNMMIRASSIKSDGYVDHGASDIKSVMVSGKWSTSTDRIRFNFLNGRERTGISWWGVPSDSLKVNRRFNPAGIYTDSEGNIRYYDDETDNYLQDHYHLFYTHKFSQALSLNTGFHYTYGAGYYEEQKSDQDTEEYGLGPIMWGTDVVTESDMVVRKWMKNSFYGAVWSLVNSASELEWIIGGSANRYDGDHFGNLMWMQYPGTYIPGYEWYRNNGLKDEVSLYGKLNAGISPGLNGFIDLQYRYIDYKIKGIDDDMRDLTQNHFYNFFNPKAGFYWSDGKGSDAYLSASVAHREPTRSNFTDAAGDIAVTPRPERLIDFEGGYTYRTASLSLSLNLYLMLYHDQLVPTGKISNVGYPVMTNVKKSYRSGIELTGNWRPSYLAAFKMNLTVSSNKIQDFRNYYTDYNTSDWSSVYTWSDLGKVDIAYSPSVTASAEIEVNPLRNAALRLNGKYVGKQYFDNTMSDDRAIDPYFVSNIIAEYRINTKRFAETDLRIQVNNLFNSLYVNNAYGGMWAEDGEEKTWAYYFPQAGTNYMFGVTFTF